MTNYTPTTVRDRIQEILDWAEERANAGRIHHDELASVIAGMIDSELPELSDVTVYDLRSESRS